MVLAWDSWLVYRRCASKCVGFNGPPFPRNGLIAAICYGGPPAPTGGPQDYADATDLNSEPLGLCETLISNATGRHLLIISTSFTNFYFHSSKLNRLLVDPIISAPSTSPLGERNIPTDLSRCCRRARCRPKPSDETRATVPAP